MDLERLGGMVAQAQQEQGISDYLLEHEIGVVDGKAFNAAQLGRLKRGERKLPVPPKVIWRLIKILHLPPIETAEAAGVWPPGITADMIRKLDLVAVDDGRVTARKVAIPLAPELEDAELLRRLGVPQLHERRQRDRRHLHLVRPVAA